jgi:type I restriction enzyme S subunit
MEGDLVITREAPMGEVCMIPPGLRCCLGQRMVLLRPNRERAEPRYLLYALQSKAVQHEIGVNEGTGSTVSNLRIPLLESLPIPTRPLPEQRSIAHILGTLDDKIELNRRINETLESIARALFTSWFVDFDPVRAKAEGRDPGLPQHLADLFPDRLIDSGLGDIPEGWEAGTLAEMSTLNPEAWSRQAYPAKINYLDLSNTKWGRIEAVMEYEAADAPSRAQRVLRPGDTIVGTVRPGNGSYALISEDGLTGTTGFAVLRPRTAQSQEFVFLAATGAENIDALAHLADGGAYPAVRPELVAATPVVRPSDQVLGRFSAAAGPLLAKVACIHNASRTVAALRDTLLPRLIAGELRVTDAERFIGRRS